MHRLVFVVMFAGCGSKPQPKPPPAEREVTGIGTISGEWVADDDMAWSYALTIRPDGAFTGRVDRGKLPPCERAVRLTPKGARRFALAMTKNTCEPGVAHAGVADVEVASFTGDVLTIVVTAEGRPEQRTYTRRPD
ncbi:MAG TPA: hypothetical protein VK427_13430 [Kofleriaceae bacterium]|nr:hypothetical protein [Kofleriaceae bacterium]